MLSEEMGWVDPGLHPESFPQYPFSLYRPLHHSQVSLFSSHAFFSLFRREPLSLASPAWDGPTGK